MTSITNRDAVIAWMESLPVLAEPKDSKQAEAIRQLVGGEGLATLIGLMMGSRQALYVALAHLPLGNSTDAARASVLQGQIKGIDLLRETILELFPSDDANAGATK